MRRRTQRRLIFIAQILGVAGLGLGALWNVASLLLELPDPGLIAFLVPLPGLVLWLIAIVAPPVLAKAISGCTQTHRLVYDAAVDWKDDAVRMALLNLTRTGSGLEIIWARDGEGMGCWLSVSEGYDDVLRRLVADVFPSGSVEMDKPPEPGNGVVLLRWKVPEIPTPAELCRMEGIEGVFFRWRDQKSATVAIWGPGATEAGQKLAKRADLLAGAGDKLQYPKYLGDNPWPNLPTFPPSRANPGLAAISNLQRLALPLRVNGMKGLILGKDNENQRIGFVLPDLKGMQALQVVGHEAEAMAINLAYQAIRCGTPVLFLDGHGSAATTLGRRLMREVAANKVLLCDVERPAQSRFRLNPLWLPQGMWPSFFPKPWLEWLRELGVTPAGLGLNAYRHTVMAVVLTALIAAKKNLTLDPVGLRDALQIPDFLTVIEDDLSQIVGAELWQWWLNEGRKTSNFDVHLRLGHLRDRLTALQEIPEYRVLWQAPYLDPTLVLENGLSLLWRLPDPRQRLQPYVTSQLLPIITLLDVWPVDRPLLIFLHELNLNGWAKRLRQMPMVRLVLVSEQQLQPPMLGKPSALLLSQLDRQDAEAISQNLPGIRATDLRRLPAGRFLLQRGQVIGTLDLEN